MRAKLGAPDNPLKARASRLGLKLVEREWIPSSRRAHECTEFARTSGKLQPFHAAVLSAYWSGGQDLHEWPVLEAAATTAGLDPTAMRSAVEAGAFKLAVDARVGEAAERGVHAVPTFLIGDRFLVQGAQEYPVFVQAMERLGAATRPAAK